MGVDELKSAIGRVLYGLEKAKVALMLIDVSIGVRSDQRIRMDAIRSHMVKLGIDVAASDAERLVDLLTPKKEGE